MLTITEIPTIRYTQELEDELMYLTDDELICFFQENKIEYKEELLTVVMRFHNEGI